MIHSTAEVSDQAIIGRDTRVWGYTQIGSGARIGAECIVGRDVYIDRDVIIGNRVKIQTGVQIYRGSVVEDGVFLGPGVCLTNDKYPRAITVDGRLKRDADWEIGGVHIGYGASIGAGSVILPNVTIGQFAMVGAGSVVARNVPDHGLVAGNPARLIGYVCKCGHVMAPDSAGQGTWTCPTCGGTISTSADTAPESA